MVRTKEKQPQDLTKSYILSKEIIIVITNSYIALLQISGTIVFYLFYKFI